MFSTRSTSPPKSAWPGVSKMLIFTPSCITAVFLDRIVIPRSRSRSLESITRSSTCSFARKTPLCFSIASTKVVLPWSTWAIMAILRMSFLIMVLFSPHFILPNEYKQEKGCLSSASFHGITKILYAFYGLLSINFVSLFTKNTASKAKSQNICAS